MLRKLREKSSKWRNRTKNVNKDGNIILVRRLWTEAEVDIYYGHLRDEIKREDTISLARMAALLTFQGFTLSAVGLLMTANWPNDLSSCLTQGALVLRFSLLFFLGLAGLFIAFLAGRGIKASIRALEVIKDEWEKVLYEAQHLIRLDNVKNDLMSPAKNRLHYIIYPRAYGPRLKLGGGFSMALPRAFTGIWTFYLLTCVIIAFSYSGPYWTMENKFPCFPSYSVKADA